MSELRIESWTMPAASLGAENPLPPLRDEADLHAVKTASPDAPREILENSAYGRVRNILPYTLQDGYDRERRPRAFRVAVLENDLLRATFLLEMGGRLWSLLHKPSGRELLYVNPVFQPANLALRNAWFSGGVEWNIGTIGHSPFTCSPLFAARVEGPDGAPILRLYEWERIRQVPFQIDACLPDGSPVLLVRVRIANPHDRVTPMYWWSNIAAPETPSTRVLAPADWAFRFTYDALDVIPVPVHDGVDHSYPTHIGRATDFFFDVPRGRRPWIAALDEAGKGLAQTSTARLRGRKLFVWGQGPGGQTWQRFLSRPDEAYFEIQAGLAQTQLEHLPMPAGAEWSWLEAYGLLEADPNAVHSGDWPTAQRTANQALDRLIPPATLADAERRLAAFADEPPVEMLQRGSGWGALEALRRRADGQPPFAFPRLPFDEDSLGPDQAPWVALLREGALPDDPALDAPAGYLVQDEWRVRLEESVQTARGRNWLAWLHLGVMRHHAGHRAGAAEAWRRSLAEAATPWALRNLAILAGEEGQTDEAADRYVEAMDMQPASVPLIIECGQALLDAGQPRRWRDLLATLPPSQRDLGRVRLLEAQAALALDDFDAVAAFFDDEVVLPDQREGRTSLSDLWFAYHEQRLSAERGRPVDDELRAYVHREYPVPAAFDFRMKG